MSESQIKKFESEWELDYAVIPTLDQYVQNLVANQRIDATMVDGYLKREFA